MNVLLKPLLLLLATLFCYRPCLAQEAVIVNLAALDGLDITPDNIMNFQLQSGYSSRQHVLVRGTLQYRRSDLRISYEFEYDLEPGVNTMTHNQAPVLRYSSSALRELFEFYKRLPQGIYEYCVTVQPYGSRSEANKGVSFNECSYHKAEDIFLINLIDPEDDARIYDYHPVLSWTVNYPFAAALSYRLRVAAMKPGQNAAAAISRNNPVYDERNLLQLSQVYPAYARPLEQFVPYAWTVDAYYKGILLGGAAPWKFTIIEDSLFKAVPRDPSFVDIKRESGAYNLYAPGQLKLKYILDEGQSDTLRLELRDKQDKPLKLRLGDKLPAVYGDNRFVLDFKETQPLRHLQPYTLLLYSGTGAVYRILFRYVNPDLIR